MHGKEGAHVAHIGVAGEYPMGHGVIGRHIGHLGQQHEIRALGEPVMHIPAIRFETECSGKMRLGVGSGCGSQNFSKP